jgi:hypothetical protein
MQYHPAVESLESRIAPSVVIINGGKGATYTDVDGDHVTILVSTGGLTAGNFTTVPSGGGDQLEKLDLTAAGFEGASVTVKVAKAVTGDGLVDIGAIDATGRDLVSVKLPGDLGQIDAGSNAMGKAAIKSLSVDSIGRLDLSTQAGGGSLESDLNGAFGSLSVKHDFTGAFFDVDGSIGKIAIGGSLEGGAANSSGVIQGSAIGSVKIGGEIVGGIAANESGGILSLGGIGSVSVGHSILGGAAGNKSGFISAFGDVGKVTVGGDLQGGAATGSGEITATGTLSALTIAGSVHGDTGAESGYIDAVNLGSVKIGRDLDGGSGSNNEAGYIAAIGGSGSGNIASLTIGGSAVGSLGPGSAGVFSSGNIGTVKIAGSLVGGPATNAGSIICGGTLNSVTIGGSLLGGSSVSGHAISDTGCIIARTLVANVKIGGNIVGGSSANASVLSDSGVVEGANPGKTSGSVGKVTVGGSILQGYIENSSGSSGNFLGTIYGSEDVGLVQVKHDLIGGSIAAQNGNLAGVTIGGSLVGQTIVGGTGYAMNGFLGAGGTVGPIKIGGSVIGGNADDSSMVETGCIAGGRLTSIKISGSLIAGTATNGGTLGFSGAIVSLNDIASISIGGNVVGSSTNRVEIIGRGQLTQGPTTDIAIGGLTIGGRVEMADILAGFSASPTGLSATNADAQIGAVKVGGSWTASNLVAGVVNTGAPNFGDSHDVPISGGNSSITSKIASISIGGPVYGTPSTVNAGDSFGFVAQSIGTVKIAGLTLAPTSGGDILVSATGDVFVHEIAPTG